MTPGRSYTLLTGLFYAGLLALFFISIYGSCETPFGTGMTYFMFIIMPYVAGMLFLLCLIAFLRGKRKFIGPAIINGFFCIAILLFRFFTQYM